MKNSMKKSLSRFLLAVLILLALCGCSQGTPADNREQTATQPAPRLIINYLGDFRSIINEDGLLIAKSAADTEAYVLNGDDGKQAGVIKLQYDREYIPNDWRYLTHNTVVTFYDAWGNQLNHIDFQREGEISFDYCGGDLSTGLFLAIQQDYSGYQVLKYDGTLLLDKQIELDEGMACNSIYMEQNGTIILVTYNQHDEDWNNWRTYTDVWDMQGNPVELARDYNNIYAAYDDSDVHYGRLPYFIGWYNGPQNVTLYDVLNVDGSVMVEGLNDYRGINGDLIICRKGFEQGLMDFNGNWIYKESLFAELED